MRNASDCRQPDGDGKSLRPEDSSEGNFSQIEWGKFLLTSVTGLAVLIYAIGYCCHVGHHKMLGISQIEYANEIVILDGVQFFILIPLCVFLALSTSWLVWVILPSSGVVFLLRQFAPSVTWRESHTWRSIAILLGAVNVTGMILLLILFFVLTAVVCMQQDQLFVSGNQSAGSELHPLFEALTSHSPRLTELLETHRSRAVYGELFIIAIICIVWWLGRILKATGSSKSSKEISVWKRIGRQTLTVVGLYIMLLLTVLVFFLYGFLVKSNEFPVIELQMAKANWAPCGTLFALGDCGSRTLLYSPDEGEIWWVEKSTCLPASRSGPRQNLFKAKTAGESDRDCHHDNLKQD